MAAKRLVSPGVITAPPRPIHLPLYYSATPARTQTPCQSSRAHIVDARRVGIVELDPGLRKPLADVLLALSAAVPEPLLDLVVIEKKETLLAESHPHSKAKLTV